MSKRIYLAGKPGQGKFTLVDDADFEWLNQYTWRLGSAGYPIRYDGGVKYVLMHRQILSLDGTRWGDHINRDKLDNRRCNLRPATYTENARNSSGVPNTSSVFKGVHLDRQTQRWRAEIRTTEGSIKLGRFDSELEAAQAYNEAAAKHFGEFAYLNDLAQEPSHTTARPKRAQHSRFQGVSRKRGRWLAFISTRGKFISLGCFDSEEEAAKRRDEYIQQHGLPRKLNFPH